MKTLIIDASVAAKLLFEEDGTAAAEEVMRQRNTRFLAPDLLPIELASIIWKRSRRAELTSEEARAALALALRLPIETLPSPVLLGAALEIALAMGSTVYDALYVAAAVAHSGVLVTADQRLAAAISSGPLASSIRSLVERV